MDSLPAARRDRRNPTLRTVGSGDAFLLCFLGTIAWFGLYHVYALLFQIFGVERLVLSRGTLMVSRGIGRFGSRAAYRVSDVSDLRVIPGPTLVPGTILGRSKNGRLAFTIGTRTRRFGGSMDVDEGVKLAQLLSARGMR